MVYSRQLGEAAQVTPVQIRKDLSYFGRLGKPGQGYSVSHLLEQMKEIVGINRQRNVVLAGAGRLGTALLSYPGFASGGFKIVAAFDANRRLVGRTIGNLKVRSMEELDRTISKWSVTIAIVAVPSQHAQEVVDQLAQCGVKSILNYAPIPLQVPEGVRVRNIDPALLLQTMTFYLSNADQSRLIAA